MTRKTMTTSIQVDLLKEFRHLAIDVDKPFNKLLEEAIRNLLKKYSMGGVK